MSGRDPSDLEEEEEPVPSVVGDVPDYEHVVLVKNHKQDLECLGFILVVGIIIIAIFRGTVPGFTFWWAVVPIALFIIGIIHAEKYQKSVDKVVTHYRRVKVDRRYPKGMKECFDAEGKDKASIPDEDMALYEYSGIVEHEEITSDTLYFQDILKKTENNKIVKRENKFLTMDELDEAVLKYGGKGFKDASIELIKWDSVHYHKTKNRNSWDVTSFQEEALIFPKKMDESVEWGEATIPAAGWKFGHSHSTSIRTFHVGTLVGDFPCSMVTACDYLDHAKELVPTSDKLASGLNRIMEKLYDRADKRSDQLRVLLDRKREGDKATEGREKRENVERARQRIKGIHSALDSSNYEERTPRKKAAPHKWGWAVVGIVVAVLMIVLL